MRCVACAEILTQKKTTYANVAKTINETKSRIDVSRRQLDAMKRDREAMGPIYNEDGDVIISEEEFVEINKLKSLKGTALMECGRGRRRSGTALMECGHGKAPFRFCPNLWMGAVTILGDEWGEQRYVVLLYK